MNTKIYLIFIAILITNFQIFASDHNFEKSSDNNHKFEIINQSVRSISCDFSDIEKYFQEYLPFFGVTWDEVKNSYKCEDVMNLIMEKEKKRLTMTFNVTSQKEGIRTGTLIFYGYYIKPPYVFTIDAISQKLFINNQYWKVVIPKVEEPIVRQDRKDFQNLADHYQFQLWNNEERLEDIEVSNINSLIEQWKGKFSKEEVLYFLEEYINKLQIKQNIKYYNIYDRDKLLYDLVYYYVQDYEINPKYYNDSFFTKNNHKISDKNTNLNEEIKYRKKYYLDKISDERKSFINALADKNDVFLVYPNTEDFRKAQSIEKMLYVILADGTEYQKITYIIKNLKEHPNLAKLLVFNFQIEDALYLIKQFGIVGDK